MGTKQNIKELLQRLPDDVSLYEVTEKIRFIAGVNDGFDSYEREGGVTVEEAKARVSVWAADPRSCSTAKRS